MAVQVAKWTMYNLSYAVFQDGAQHFIVLCGVYDGTKWQYHQEGSRKGYKTLPYAMQTYQKNVDYAEAIVARRGL